MMATTAQEGTAATTITIDTTNMATTDPWMLFLYALKAPATKEKYVQRLIKFLDFLGYQGTKEEKARAFAAQTKADPVYAFNSVLKFFQSKREQIDRKEIAIGTVRNYVKSIKLICDMAAVNIMALIAAIMKIAVIVVVIVFNLHLSFYKKVLNLLQHFLTSIFV
jgi:hypothetical protein